MANKYLDLTGLGTLLTGVKTKVDAGLATKLDKNATAVAANKLATPRTIAGVAFDGTANIAITAGNVGAYTKAEADNLLSGKVDKVVGKGLSTNDYTTAEKTKLAGIAENANNYVHPASHPATMIVEDATHRFATDAEKAVWADKYTKAETDNKISTAVSGISWKAAVATFADIETTYPNPVDGWTVNVNDTDITYRYTGKEWIAISANAIPVATASVDGKMSKTDKAKLDGIAANANNYVHPANHRATMIVEDATHRFATDAEKAAWADKYTKAETGDLLNAKLDVSATLTESEINSAINGVFGA